MAYLPFFFGTWATTSLFLLDRFLHLLFSGIFAFLAGFLIERERRHQKQAEKDRYLAGIGQVATTIVHDLKNPLIAILAFAKRIREGKGNPDKAAEAIWDSAQTMQKIVESTLDFARPVQLEIKEEELTDIIHRALHACKPKAEENGVNLSARVPKAPMKIALDGHHVERALMNLVANSIDASNAGQEVVISAEKKETGCIIKVKDNGSGMDKKVLENVFLPFYTKKKKGTGLGMPIVKKIVEGHSGKIRIDTRIGHGTEVVLELPCRSPTENQP